MQLVVSRPVGQYSLSKLGLLGQLCPAGRQCCSQAQMKASGNKGHAMHRRGPRLPPVVARAAAAWYGSSCACSAEACMHRCC